MESSNKDLHTSPKSKTTSLLSYLCSIVLCVIIGFVAWYFLLRPDDESFPFSQSWLEIVLMVALMGVVGFWIGPNVEKWLAKSRYQLFILYIVTGLLLFGAGIGAGYLIWGIQASKEAAQADSGEEEIIIPEDIKRFDVPIDDDPILGPENAVITIIQFADFECPFCAEWQSEVWPEIVKTFPDQVRLVFRDFPLYGMHPNAESAAEAANCASEQNEYWEYHDKLFEAENGLGMSALKQYAKDVGIDVEQFTECMESNRFINEVKADYDFATGIGISSVPTFFINGIPIVGAQPFSVFKQIISKELAGEIP